jgi:hypothetical protein
MLKISQCSRKSVQTYTGTPNLVFLLTRFSALRIWNLINVSLLIWLFRTISRCQSWDELYASEMESKKKEGERRES